MTEPGAILKKVVKIVFYYNLQSLLTLCETASWVIQASSNQTRHVTDTLLTYGRSIDADLIIVNTHDGSGLTQIFRVVSSIDERGQSNFFTFRETVRVFRRVASIQGCSVLRVGGMRMQFTEKRLLQTRVVPAMVVWSGRRGGRYK